MRPRVGMEVDEMTVTGPRARARIAFPETIAMAQNTRPWSRVAGNTFAIEISGPRGREGIARE